MRRYSQHYQPLPRAPYPGQMGHRPRTYAQHHSHNYMSPIGQNGDGGAEIEEYGGDYQQSPEMEEVDLGEEQFLDDFFDALEDEKSTPPDFGWGPEPRHDSPIDQARGVEQRELLSDFVRRGDPRSKEERSRWTPDRSFLLRPRGDNDRAPDNGVSLYTLLDMNIHGLTHMQSMNDEEMRLAMQTSRAQIHPKDIAMQTSPTDILPEEIAEKLLMRFVMARGEAQRVESRILADSDLPIPPSRMPTHAASKVASQPPGRIHAIFDKQIRANDTERAMAFYRSDPHHLAALLRSAREADANERSQYGNHVRDLIARMEDRLNNSDQPAPISVSQSWHPAHPLNIPVFSHAKWVISGAPLDSPDLPGSHSAAATEKKRAPAYYRRGNDQFMAAHMKMRSAESRVSAEQDAIRFFRNRFGLDFSKESGATIDPKTGTIAHANLPLVFEPYTVCQNLSSRLQAVEGHLGAASVAPSSRHHADMIGNGYHRFGAGADAEGTSIAEAGWMVRPTSPKGVVLGSAGSRATLPRGGILATGFWIVDRPNAAPALLRFQSARVPVVQIKKLPGANGGGGGGVQHVSTNFYHVADMTHDGGARPYKGIGSALNITKVEHPELENIEAHTWVSLVS
jgi:hypothetical protein